MGCTARALQFYRRAVRDTIGLVMLTLIAWGHVLMYVAARDQATPLIRVHWLSQHMPDALMLGLWVIALVLCMMSLGWRRLQSVAVSYTACLAFMWGVSFLVSSSPAFPGWSAACNYLGIAFFVTWGFARQPHVHKAQAVSGGDGSGFR